MKFFLSVNSFRSNFDAKRIPKLGNKMIGVTLEDLVEKLDKVRLYL